MLRRNIRLRKEYLYRKALEGEERERYEKKRKIRKALAEGKPIPTDLKDDFIKLDAEMKFEDEQHSVPRPLLDDEYQNAGILDPKIFITTSRDPSSRLIQFAKVLTGTFLSNPQKELQLVFPNSVRRNRGAHIVGEIVEACRANEMTDIIIVHETRGEPDALIVSHLPFGPTAYFGLANVVLRHDVQEKKAMSQQNPHLIFDNFSTQLGERVMTILKYLFPTCKDDARRVVSFANRNDYISFRHHYFKKTGKEVELKEIGPRFEMKLYQIKLGTVEMIQADNEWVLRPYMRSAKKKNYL